MLLCPEALPRGSFWFRPELCVGLGRERDEEEGGSAKNVDTHQLRSFEICNQTCRLTFEDALASSRRNTERARVASR